MLQDLLTAVQGDIIPILQQASQGSVSAKQGCCLAFAEMLESTTKTQLEGQYVYLHAHYVVGVLNRFAARTPSLRLCEVHSSTRVRWSDRLLHRRSMPCNRKSVRDQSIRPSLHCCAP